MALLELTDSLGGRKESVAGTFTYHYSIILPNIFGVPQIESGRCTFIILYLLLTLIFRSL